MSGRAGRQLRTGTYGRPDTSTRPTATTIRSTRVAGPVLGIGPAPSSPGRGAGGGIARPRLDRGHVPRTGRGRAGAGPPPAEPAPYRHDVVAHDRLPWFSPVARRP